MLYHLVAKISFNNTFRLLYAILKWKGYPFSVCFMCVPQRIPAKRSVGSQIQTVFSIRIGE